MASNEQYFAAIILSIIATSTFIGFVNLAYNNKFPDLSSAHTVVPTYAGFDTTITKTKYATSGITVYGQDYTNHSGYSTNISIIRGGTWTQVDSLGYQVDSGIFSYDPLITIKNVKSNADVYTVSYIIKNTPNEEFYLTPRYLAGGKTSSDIRLQFKKDGIYIPTYPLIAGLFYNGFDFFYSLPNSQETLPAGSTIETVLTDVYNGPGGLPYVPAKNSQLSVSKDGSFLFSTYVRDLAAMATETDFNNLPPLTTGQLLDYAGAGSQYQGFTIVKISTPIQYLPDAVTSKDEAGFFEALTGLANLLMAFFSGVSLFITNLGTILAYSISSDICPVWITAIVLTPQLAGLSLIVVKLIRGTP
jgi:hypothetical protein